jgi:hypothetical protein
VRELNSDQSSSLAGWVGVIGQRILFSKGGVQSGQMKGGLG